MSAENKKNRPESPREKEIGELITRPDEIKLDVSVEGASLQTPLSQEEQIREVIERLVSMTKNYTLGLDSDKADVHQLLAYLNENFSCDRPLETTDLDPGRSLKKSVKKMLFPIMYNTLQILFKRQREFNGELVKLLNRFSEVFGNQRDFNMEIIKNQERFIEHYRMMEQMDRRIDDFFGYITRVTVLEEEVEELQSRLGLLEQQKK